MGKRAQSTVDNIDLAMFKRQKARLDAVLTRYQLSDKDGVGNLVRMTHEDYMALTGIQMTCEAIIDNVKPSGAKKEWTIIGMYDDSYQITGDGATAKDGIQAMRKAALERKRDDGGDGHGFNLICAIPGSGQDIEYASDVEPIGDYLARFKRKIKKEDAT